MKPVRVVAGSFVGVVAAVALAACNAGGPPVGAGGGTTTAAPSAPVAPAAPGGGAQTSNAAPGTGLPGVPASLPGGVPGSLPSGFPVPGDATSSTVLTDHGEVLATMNVGDPDAAYHFWLTELPKAGYQIVGQPQVVAAGTEVTTASIQFSGHGYNDKSGIQIAGPTVVIWLNNTDGGDGKSGSDGLTIHHDGNFTCTGGEAVTIAAVGNLMVTLTGPCGTVEVRGDGNQVTVADADKIQVGGSGNSVAYGGDPVVTDSGTANSIAHT